MIRTVCKIIRVTDSNSNFSPAVMSTFSQNDKANDMLTFHLNRYVQAFELTALKYGLRVLDINITPFKPDKINISMLIICKFEDHPNGEFDDEDKAEWASWENVINERYEKDIAMYKEK